MQMKNETISDCPAYLQEVAVKNRCLNTIKLSVDRVT